MFRLDREPRPALRRTGRAGPALLLALAASGAAFAALPRSAAWAGDPAPATGAAPAVSGPVAEALQAFEAGEWAKVVEIGAKVPESDPARSKAQYLVGEAELARGGNDAAATAFRAVLAKKSASVPAMTGLARALMTKRDDASYDEAEKLLRKAVAADAKDVGAQRALGELHTAKGRHDEAKKVLEAARKLDPKDPLTNRALVEAHLRAEASSGESGSVDGAEKAAAAFAKAAPDSAMAPFLTGLVADRKGSVKEAIEAYEKCLAKDDRFLDAHKNLAIVCMARNAMYQDHERLDKSLAHYEKYFALGGKDTVLEEQYRTLLQYVDYIKGGAPPEDGGDGAGKK